MEEHTEARVPQSLGDLPGETARGLPLVDEIHVGWSRFRPETSGVVSTSTPPAGLPPTCSTKPSYRPPAQIVPCAPRRLVTHSKTVKL